MTTVAQLRDGLRHSGLARQLELQTQLRHRHLVRPRSNTEARLGCLRERPYAEVLAAADLFAGEVLTVELLERQAERVHVERATGSGVRRDDGNAGDELDLHAAPPE